MTESVAKTAATQTQVLALELGLTDSAQKEIIQKHLVAMLAMERRDKWEPIETAPKDGTDILVCEAGRQGVEMVAWKGGEKRGGWHTEDGSTSYGDGIFTHWQPLPTTPEGGEQP